MAKRVTNRNQQKPTTDNPPAVSTPIDNNLPDNIKTDASNDPNEEKQNITVKIIQPKSNHPVLQI